MGFFDITVGIESFIAANLDSNVKLQPPNVKFGGNPSEAFVTMTHVPVDSGPLTIGNTGVLDTEGVLILGFHFPPGEGSGATLARIDQLATVLRPGLSIPAGSGNAVVSKVTLGTREPSSQVDWFVIPLVMYYHAFHTY